MEHLREIRNKPADVHQILEWILSNIKVSELEDMSITIVGPKDYSIRILGSKMEEINNRAWLKYGKTIKINTME